MPDKKDEKVDTPPDDQKLDDKDKKIDKAIEGADDSQKSLKDQLGEALGKEFPDDETALKAVKDTFSYVGKLKNLKDLDSVMSQLQRVLNTDQRGVITKIEDIVKTGGKVDPSKFVPREEFVKTNFYNENPDFKPYSKLVENWKTANPDKSREEIVESDEFREVFDKVVAQDKAAKTKSVLKSSSKLGGVTDKITEARQALKEGKREEAEKKAVEAVTDAFPVE